MLNNVVVFLVFHCSTIFVPQDGGRTVLLDKQEIHRIVSSCNDFAEAEKQSKHQLLDKYKELAEVQFLISISFSRHLYESFVRLVTTYDYTVSLGLRVFVKDLWLKKIIDSTELEAVARINTAIRLGNAVETVEELVKPEAQLPIVYQTAANLYQHELFSLQLQGARVRRSDFSLVGMNIITAVPLLSFVITSTINCIWMIFLYVYQSGLSHEELSVAVEMLSAVAVLNEVLDTKDPQAVSEQLTDSPLGFTNIDHDNLNR